MGLGCQELNTAETFEGGDGEGGVGDRRWKCRRKKSPLASSPAAVKEKEKSTFYFFLLLHN